MARTTTAERQRQSPPADQKPSTALATREETSVSFVPLGESQPIKLSVAIVMNTVATPTRAGHLPSYADCMNFIMLCRARGLNPFVGDAYLIGYDSDDGPKFSLITAIQSLRKRAEANPNFDGCRRGIIVKSKTNAAIVEREGAMLFDDEIVIGGWAEAFRKDYSIQFRETVKLSTYDKNRSLWKTDKEGMIQKVAEAAALRRAFPSDVGGLYLTEEFGEHRERIGKVANGSAAQSTAAKLADLANRPEPGTNAATTPTAAADAASEPPELDDAPDEPGEQGGPTAASGPSDASLAKVAEYRAKIKACMGFAEVDAVVLNMNVDESIRTEQFHELKKLAGEHKALIAAADAEAAGD